MATSCYISNAKSPDYLVSCCSLALRDKPLGEAAKRVASAGFRGIEIWHSHVSKLSQAEQLALAEHCRELRLTVPLIAPYFSFTRGEQFWQESLRTAGDALEVATVFGAGKIRTFVDIGDDGLPSNRATQADWNAAITGLKALCAMDTSVEFVLETHKNTLADSVPSVLRLLAEVAAPNLRLNFQHNADFLQRGYLASLETLFPHVSHFHWQQVLADGRETYMEERGLIDFPALFKFLQEKHYSGTASVEYCWTPVDENRLDSACAFLGKHLS